MNTVVVVVLVAGVAILARVLASRKGFSHNQRIVLSAVAVGLLLWDLFSSPSGVESGKLAMVVLVVLLLGSSLLFMRRRSR